LKTRERKKEARKKKERKEKREVRREREREVFVVFLCFFFLSVLQDMNSRMSELSFPLNHDTESCPEEIIIDNCEFVEKRIEHT